MAERDSFRAAHETCKQDLVKVTERCSNLEDRLNDTMRRLQGAESLHETLTKERERLLESVAASGAELVSLRKNLAEASDKASKTESRANEIEGKLAELQPVNASQAKEIELLGSIRDKALADLGQLGSHHTTVTKERDDLRAKSASTESDLVSAKDQLERVRADLEATRFYTSLACLCPDTRTRR